MVLVVWVVSVKFNFNLVNFVFCSFLVNYLHFRHKHREAEISFVTTVTLKAKFFKGCWIVYDITVGVERPQY